jgi:tetratricopeptide (TPR) repeat protein
MGTRRRAAAVMLLALAGAGPAAAQSNDRSTEALRARQAEIFRAMLTLPDDPALMRDYIDVSVALRDNEAVISTLERALIFNPGDPALLMELGAAYFRLGSNGEARAAFEAARPAASPAQRDRIDAFLGQIGGREARSRFSGAASLGVVASSNANLGGVDRTLRLNGFDVVAVEGLDARAGEGWRAIAQVAHEYDLGGPDADLWRTDAAAYALDFFDEDAGDVQSLSFATGPSLGLGPGGGAARVRPFAALRTVRSAGDPLFTEYGVGVEGGAPLDGAFTLLGAAGGGYRDYAGSGAEGFDGATARAQVGLGYATGEGFTGSAALFAETDRARDDAQADVEGGLRLGGAYDYDPGFGGLPAWRVSLFGQASVRRADEPDPAIDPGETRRDVDLRLNAAHLFRLGGGFGVQMDVDLFRQRSTIANYDVESVSGAVSLVYEF